ncbi:MAG TPA: HlyD family secretion protein, partial [Burkholderiaceae bacterium]|nr:HlyD family secretion protein [Burkholderiaceae bacterium]
QGVSNDALMVPQQAVQRTADGLSTLMLVKDGKVSPQAVELGSQVNGKWIVTKGLNPGDEVIVEGFQKIRPGVPVQPLPWKNPTEASAAGAKPAAAPAEKGAGTPPKQG